MLICKNELVENASTRLKKIIKVDFPEKYALFLDRYNGGPTYNTKVKISRKWDELDGFYGLGSATSPYTFEGLKHIGILDDFLDKHLLPIANNEMGDYYCLSLESENFGTIYFYYHDFRGENKKVFSNFEEFLQHIKSEYIGHVPSIEEREATAIANGYGHKIHKLLPIWQKEIDKFSNMKQEEVSLD